MTPWFTSGCYPADVAVDWDEVLKRQIEYFSSDELLRDRAAVYRELTPEECWVKTRCCASTGVGSARASVRNRSGYRTVAAG
jgi:hypothetical protein